MNEFFKFILGINRDIDYSDSFFSSFGIYVAIITIVLCLAVFTILCLSNKNANGNILPLAFAGVCIGLSFALSYARMFKMPNGGSVTYCSFLPICLYAYIFGFRRGLLAGVIYGVLQIIQDPYILNFVQILLDYILAFATISIAGLIPHILNKLKGSKVGNFINKFDFSISLIFVGLARMLFHVVSGLIFFGNIDASFGDNLLFSLGYNSFVLVDIAICIVPAFILQLSKPFMLLIKKIRIKTLNKELAFQIEDEDFDLDTPEAAE